MLCNEMEITFILIRDYNKNHSSFDIVPLKDGASML